MSTKKTIKKAPKKAIKKSVKKAPKKTKIGKKKASQVKKKQVRALVCAPGKNCFWTTDGTVLENLDHLQIAFGSMEDEVFLHHVTKKKNDFADWVEYVLNDAQCAEDLRRARKSTSARVVVVRHLRNYSS